MYRCASPVLTVRKPMIFHLRAILCVCVALCGPLAPCGRALMAEVPPRTPDSASEGIAALGRALFLDPNLSANRTQSCASCHDPARAFSDARENGVGGAVSLGDDGRSLGDRNAPATTYAFMSPPFGRDAGGAWAGGQFHDGRAATLVEQAAEPFTNPLEMALSGTAAVVARVRENPWYVEELTRLFGAGILTDHAQTFGAVTASLAAFERSAPFAAFDSRYDRYLRGEYAMSDREEMGRSLFFSSLTNCSSCHVLNTSAISPREPFTNYRYHNIGIPVNAEVRARNGLGSAHRDPGLLANPAVDDPAMAGKFKVPSLRNVAVTAPYMHNGVFRELRTAVLFYNKYTVHSEASRTNPESGKPWGEPEFGDTIDLELLAEGQPIDDVRVDALIAFLETLTDRRYEPLLGAAGRPLAGDAGLQKPR